LGVNHASKKKDIADMVKVIILKEWFKVYRWNNIHLFL